MENQKETFTYTYSAEQQEEIRRIREKYVPKEEDKMKQLRRLDEGVTRKGNVISLILGIIGCLIMGTGMSCTMVWTDTLLFPGIVIGVIGMVMVIMAYPLYQHIVKKERQKIAAEIIRLTDELMK